MTNEEAIEILLHDYYSPDTADAVEVAIEALKKQIAKKPVVQYDPPYENPADDEPWYLCPCCMNANIMYPEHHCECGQRLDWSEFRYPEKELEKWKKK